MCLWIILYTTMRVNRSHFITICLVVLLLCDDVALPRQRVRRNRQHRKRLGRGRKCRPVPETIMLTFPNCRRTKVKTFGCAGRCLSETSLMENGQGIIPKGSCCKPDKQTRFYTFVTCAGNEPLKRVPLLAARSCSCHPCGNCFVQFFH